MTRVEHSEQTIKAAKYIQYGLKTRFISQETKLPAKYVRELNKDITGHSQLPGQLASVSTLLKTKKSLMLCILLLTIYQKSASPLTTTTINLDRLITIFDCFTRHINKLKTLQNSQQDTLFTINNAWVLINALLNNEIQLSHCHCGCTVIITDSLPITLKCPFCSHLKPLSFKA